MAEPGNGERQDLVRDGLMTVPEAAAFLRLSRSTVYALMNSGQLLYVRIGRARLNRRAPRGRDAGAPGQVT